MTGMESKDAIRRRVWADMQSRGAARFPGAQGRIPNFVGAEAAARRLAELPEWKRAGTLKCNPDFPQLPVRTLALQEGKRIYMAVPRLRDERPFLLLDPQDLSLPPRRAASIKGAGFAGRPVRIDDMPHIDLIVCGTVAVNRDGVRIGKGGGYSDLEFALTLQMGVVDGDTLIATTVHPLQVLDEELPETASDFRVDLVVTPEEVIHCPRSPRPKGIVWEDLDDSRIDGIPVLKALARETRRGRVGP
ncbi:MAG TPA: 5-formyltetrahydrofolate cyclo-ligase [Actinomycetota bacterium]|nr:5-formyltetrahydrofolate cyclo-ligase [Actinomycetota bacterium]